MASVLKNYYTSPIVSLPDGERLYLDGKAIGMEEYTVGEGYTGTRAYRLLGPHIGFSWIRLAVLGVIAFAFPAFLSAQGAGGSAAASATANQVDLPVTHVVLYSSGVAYVEHSGEVQGAALARFAFKTDQINDVLKSMVLRDFGGGTVTSVNYASQDPIARALRSFAVDLSDKPSIAQILDRLRGAEVTINAPQAIKGRILGVETAQKLLPDGTILSEYHLALMTSEGLRSVPFSSMSATKLSDQRLSDEINRALGLMIDAADTQRRAVDVTFSGQGKRQVAVTYVAEAPVWKTSYRLDLNQANATAARTQGASTTTLTPAAGAKGFLQGWAIVENSSDSDWRNVRLSLVSGSPISFIQDLYTPLYVQRPVVGPSVQAQVRPRSYEEGIASTTMPSAASGQSAPAPRRSESIDALSDFSGAGIRGGAAETPMDWSTSAIGDTAQGGKFGELFNFAIATPVSLTRRQSAMLPLVNRDIEAEKVSIYNASVLSRHPLNGALVKNTSGLRLPPGPITVFDGGMYAGDALLDSLGENDHRLISYAIDLDVIVDPSVSTSSEITKISIVRGVLSVQRMSTFTQTYKIDNRSASPKTIIVEHPRNNSRIVKEPAQVMEQTSQSNRFRVAVPGFKQNAVPVSFVVKEQQPGTETVTLLSARPTAFQFYLTVSQASQAIKTALQQVIDAKQNLDRLQARQTDLTQQKSQLENGQGRIRSNIETVGRDTPQGQRYLQRLLEDEDKIEALSSQIETGRADIQKAQASLEEYLRNLSIE